MNQSREIAKRLLLCPQPGAAVLPALGVLGARSSRLLGSLAPGTSGPGMNCGASPTPEGLLAALLDASLMEAHSSPQQPTPLLAFPGSGCRHWFFPLSRAQIQEARSEGTEISPLRRQTHSAVNADPWPALSSDGKSSPLPSSVCVFVCGGAGDVKETF